MLRVAHQQITREWWKRRSRSWKLTSDSTEQLVTFCVPTGLPTVGVGSGSYNTTTGAFDMTTTGTVAGFPNIQFRFTGTIDAGGNMDGVVTIGGTGGLPGNQPVSYRIVTRKTA